ncbi:hypothetical protein [uncultured Corynebacterium sp.]|uniref:hypothetical protein n=1 Tax=uncultured Corynebacterium sp. TaxID=159447 RepID=UPI0026001B0F|nr:hypothetical protein [uncultured Corynebacterium sp.]
MTRYQTITRALFDPERLPAIGEAVAGELAKLDLTIVKERVAMPYSGEGAGDVDGTEAVGDVETESLMDRWLAMNAQPPTIEKLHALLIVTEGPDGLGEDVTEAIGRALGESTPWTGETTIIADVSGPDA